MLIRGVPLYNLQAPLVPLETLATLVPLEFLDPLVWMVDLEKGARLEVRELVGREEKQDLVYVQYLNVVRVTIAVKLSIRAYLAREVLMVYLDYLVNLERLVLLAILGHVVPLVQE